MTGDATTLDEAGKARWNESYVLTHNRNLWGDPPVPFVEDAAALFAADDAVEILDLPCGDGRNLRPLAARFSSVTAADASPNGLAIAERLLRAARIENVKLYEADIYDTGFVDDAFDGIFCCDVLGHLTEPRRALAELLRICRPGKCIVANVFAMGDSTRGPNMVEVGDEEYVFDDRFYFKFYDRAKVEHLLEGIDGSIVWNKLVRWTEPPHEGYREYEHEHESWLFAIRKPA